MYVHTYISISLTNGSIAEWDIFVEGDLPQHSNNGVDFKLSAIALRR